MQKITIGSVVQINEKFPNPGWIGALIIVNKITPKKIQGYLHIVDDMNNASPAFINCKHEEVEYIGQAKLTLNC